MKPDIAERLKQLRCASERNLIMEAVAWIRKCEATIERQSSTIEALKDKVVDLELARADVGSAS